MAEIRIYKNMQIEDLIEKYPQAATWLWRKGIRCVICGEPIWGTLERAALEKSYNEKEIDILIDELKINVENDKQ